MITGYNDTFQRTVSGGFGVATSGQTYTTFNTAAQFSVSAGVGSIAANTTGGAWLAYIDRQTADIDITGQVALSAVPATNLSTVGFTAKQSGSTNYYIGSFMVQTLGIMNLRISKVISGGLVTLNTTLVPGLGTYTAGTFFNIRFQCYWSNVLQANVLNMKIWAVGATEPGGWLVSITDNSITQYASGTQAGIHVRDEQTTANNTGRVKNVAAVTYGLPVPALTDPMCNDPAIAYPDQTALQSLAVAADKVMQGLDPVATLAANYPRVRVSANNLSFNTATAAAITWDTTEFNVGTPTNLAYDNVHVLLPPGLWVCIGEVQVNPASANELYVEAFDAFGATANFKVATAQGTIGVGGNGRIANLARSLDPANPLQQGIGFGSFNTQATYTIKYAAMTAIKISDYFL